MLKRERESFSRRLFRSCKKALIFILPSGILNIVRRFKTSNYYTCGFTSFDEALKKSIGYESEVILNKAKVSVRKVIDGSYAYERDTIQRVLMSNRRNFREEVRKLGVPATVYGWKRKTFLNISKFFIIERGCIQH